MYIYEYMYLVHITYIHMLTSRCINIWMCQHLGVSIFGCTTHLDISISRCIRIWMCQNLDVLTSTCINICMDQHLDMLNMDYQYLDVSTSHAIVSASVYINIRMYHYLAISVHGCIST